MSKRVANRRRPSRNRMYARGVKNAESRAGRKLADQHGLLDAAGKEITRLKKRLATPLKKVGFFRNLFSRRGR